MSESFTANILWATLFLYISQKRMTSSSRGRGEGAALLVHVVAHVRVFFFFLHPC